MSNSFSSGFLCSLLIPVTASFWPAVLSTLTLLLLFKFLLLVGISQNGLKSWAPPFLLPSLPISIFCQEELGLTVTETALGSVEFAHELCSP